MNCPNCNSDDIDQCGKFDCTLVDPFEACHDFECMACGQWFQIIYHPISTVLVEKEE